MNSVNAVNGLRPWRVATQFGTTDFWKARAGQSLLILSTGLMPNPASTGVLSEAEGSFSSINTNPDGQDLDAAGASPDPGFSGSPNTNCDGVNDCSGSITSQWEQGNEAANDFLWADFTTTPPADALGFKLDFAFFSSEFPEFVNTQFNDIFIVWVETPDFVGNQCFIGEQPCTVTALQDAADDWGGVNNLNFPGRAGTGMDTKTMGALGGPNSGQATGWFTMNGPAAANEEFRMAFLIFDMGDQVLDTTVLLDNFRWECTEACTPGLPVELGGCGIVPG
jgi:hypothetical protein